MFAIDKTEIFNLGSGHRVIRKRHHTASQCSIRHAAVEGDLTNTDKRGRNVVWLTNQVKFFGHGKNQLSNFN